MKTNSIGRQEHVPGQVFGKSSFLANLRAGAGLLRPDSAVKGDGPFRVTFAASIAQWFSPHPADLGYFDRLIVVATTNGTGAAFCPHRGTPSSVDRILGQDSRQPDVEHLCEEVAALDAAFG